MPYPSTVRWDELDAAIPGDAVPEGDDLGTISVLIGEVAEWTLLARLPGKRWAETEPPGGDFEVGLVVATQEEPFTYRRLYEELDLLCSSIGAPEKRSLIRAIGAVTLGEEAPETLVDVLPPSSPGIAPLALLLATQALSLAEHRRFAETETDGGGRRLVAELALGVILNRWTPGEATAAAGHGHIGLRQLRSETHHRGLFPHLPAYLEALEKTQGPLPIDRPTSPEEAHAQEAQLRAQALHYLRLMAGADADFRTDQWEAIRDLVLERRRLLLVQRTGWGKSAVYFIATKLMREKGSGPTILISPLISLMHNQVEMADRAGITAATLNSANESEHREIYAQVQRRQLDLLLVTPEWVAKQDFQANVLAGVKDSGMVVIDEVHCISDWGHDFRPDYRRLVDVLNELNEGVPILGTTATATKRVLLDVEEQFGDEFEIRRGSLARPGLRFGVFSDPTKPGRLAKLLEIIEGAEGTGIVYCVTVAESDRIAKWLKQKGVRAHAYNGNLPEEDRIRVERDLVENDIQVVVATKALGMGFDKPDIAFVVHFQSPPSIIEYYQEAGRAGRGIPSADAVLMVGAEDALIHDYFLEGAFVTEEEATEVLEHLTYDRGLTTRQLESRVNMSEDRIEKAVKLLDVEGAVVKGGRGWFKTESPWTFDASRPPRVNAQRQLERAALRSYSTTRECRMRFLMEQLDDQDPRDCGECDNCRGAPVAAADGALASEIQEELGETKIWIPPKKWVPATPRGWYMPARLKAEFGRAVCLYGEAGLGELVKQARETGSDYDEDVLRAVFSLLDDWPNSPPTWVSCIPTASQSGLPDLAAKVAAELGVPFRAALRKTRRTAPQLTMMNDAQRFANISFAFEPLDAIPRDPVLLLDDFTSSGWTFAVTAMTLRKQADVEKVIPLALARVIR